MPRVRSRKRLSRMDAALDAMSKFGFPKEIVKKHLRELLKEYGGDEGWPFIEDCSYKELLDAILREQERDNLEKVAEDGDQIKFQDKYCGDEGLVGTSSRASDTHQEPLGNASLHIVAAAELICPDSIHTTSVINKDENGWKGIHCHDQTTEETAKQVREDDTEPPRSEHCPRIREIPTLPSPEIIPSSPPPPKTRGRLRFYGWIESGEEDADDFITLEPSTMVLGPPKAALLRESPNVERKRRSRWDERPDDP